MTLHWNARRGFAAEPQAGTLSADGADAPEEAGVNMAELLWAMRRVPDLRPSAVQRGKKLIGDPGYPPKEVLLAVADVLSRNLGKGRSE
jgi:hypothetical protein